MALVLADRVKDTTTTTGTGAVTLSGTAPDGYRTFGSAIGDGNVTYYTIAVPGGTEWEVGVGTYTAVGTSLSRDTVLASSNANALVPFSAGVKDVFVTYPAGKSVNYDTSGNVNISVTGSAASATSLLGGAAGSLPYQSALDTTTFLATGTGVLVASGGAPSWSQTPTLTSVSLTSGTVSTAPASANDLVNKSYVDTIVAVGLHYHSPVKYEVPDTTGNLTATYNNGTAGVGATLTNAGTLGAFTPDGTVAQVGDRILIYNQTNQFENGVYVVTTVGDGSTPWVLTRSSDTNTYGGGPTGLGEGSAFFITSGNTGAGETYVCNTVGTITFGTTAITFTQVSATQVYSAGTGLTLTGTQFNLTAPVAVSLGGTGATSLTSGYLIKGNGTSAVSASVVYDDGTNVGIGTSSPNGLLSLGTGSRSLAAVATYPNPDISGINTYFLSTDGTRFTDIYAGGAPNGAAGGSNLRFLTNAITAGTYPVERMRITSAGNVGIGTSSPVSLLHVDNGIITNGRYSAQGALLLRAAAGTQSAPTQITAGSSLMGNVVGQGYDGSAYRSTAEVRFYSDATVSNTSSPGFLTLHTTPSGSTSTVERMRINSAGNVGIGTNSPATKLDVSGTVTATAYAGIDGGTF